VLVAASVLVLAASATAIVTRRAGADTGHPVGGHVRSTAAAPTPAVTETVTTSPTATPAMDYAAIFAREQSGVVRIETLSCSEAGIGTGFLLSPTLIATVNHVINQSVVVSLIVGDQRTTGTVVGADPARDLALVKANRPISGYHFRFATTTPSIGDQVAAIGFPIGNPITLTHGDVSGLGRNVIVNGISLTGMIQTDAPINPGNSGGPLIDQHGEVVGLVDALVADANGIAYAVPAAQANSAIRRWRQTPRPVLAAGCSNPLGPAQAAPDVPAPDDGQISDAQAAGIVAAFNTYFGGINSGNYAAAYAVLSPRLQSGSTEQQFADGDATSFDTGQEVLEAHAVDAHTVQVALAFTSLQTAEKGPNGDTCDDWTIDYTMIQIADGSWLIDAAAPYHGVLHTTC
jgi:serine protease Do